ncbi:MAG: DUF6810 family protein [Dehalococcoidia bacterium]
MEFDFMQIRRFISSPGSLIQANIILMGLVLMLVLAATACGSSDDTVASESGAVDEEGLRLITRPDASYTIDDLAAVGYKKNKQFDVETVPGANDIWYGFFNQQDIEVRFYSSHADALELGVESAEEVIGVTAGQRDYLIPVVNLYPAYAVVGNTVMLCERQISTCEALINALPE